MIPKYATARYVPETRFGAVVDKLDRLSQPVTKALSNNPWARVVTYPALAALLGRRGTENITSHLVHLLMAGYPNLTPLALAASGGRVADMGGIVGAITGALATDIPKPLLEKGVPLGQRLRGFTTNNYWDKFPEQLKELQSSSKLRDSGMTAPLQALSNKSPSWFGQLLQKQQAESWGTLFQPEDQLPTIPVHSSAVLFQQDAFIPQAAKGHLTDLVTSAELVKGFASRQSLADTAKKAGWGFVSAYALGQGVGTLLGLPDPVKDRLSQVGGIANAVARTGIFDS